MPDVYLNRARTTEEILECLQQLEVAFGETYPSYSSWAIRAATEVERGDKVLYRIHKSCEPIGICLAGFPTPNAAKANGLWISEAHRGKGIGTEAYLSLLNALSEYRRTVVTQCKRDNLVAIGLIRSVGYSLVGRLIHYEEMADDNLVFAKSLDGEDRNQRVLADIAREAYEVPRRKRFVPLQDS